MPMCVVVLFLADGVARVLSIRGRGSMCYVGPRSCNGVLRGGTSAWLSNTMLGAVSGCFFTKNGGVYATTACGAGSFCFNQALSCRFSCNGRVTVAPEGCPFRFHRSSQILSGRCTVVNVTRVSSDCPLCCSTVGRGKLNVTKLGFIKGTTCTGPISSGRGVTRFRFVP